MLISLLVVAYPNSLVTVFLCVCVCVCWAEERQVVFWFGGCKRTYLSTAYMEKWVWAVCPMAIERQRLS